MDIAIDCMNEQWNFISKDCSLSKNELLGAIRFDRGIRFVLDSTFFSFDNKIYKQSFGTLMGSPLSPIIADLVMRRLETVSLRSLNLDILFYYRYTVRQICSRTRTTSQQPVATSVRSNMHLKGLTFPYLSVKVSFILVDI